MKIEHRQPTRRELQALTSRRPVVRKIRGAARQKAEDLRRLEEMRRA